MKLLLKNIAMLLQIRPLTTQKVSGSQMKELPSLENAWLLLEDDVIHSFGNMSEIPNFQDIKTLDCSGKTVYHLGVTAIHTWYMQAIENKNL